MESREYGVESGEYRVEGREWRATSSVTFYIGLVTLVHILVPAADVLYQGEEGGGRLEDNIGEQGLIQENKSQRKSHSAILSYTQLRSAATSCTQLY